VLGGRRGRALSSAHENKTWTVIKIHNNNMGMVKYHQTNVWWAKDEGHQGGGGASGTNSIASGASWCSNISGRTLR